MGDVPWTSRWERLGNHIVQSIVMQRGMLDEGDEAFETWLRAWTKERIWATHGFLEGPDLHYIAKQRAAELIRLAKDRGFDDQLAEVAKPYHSVQKFVVHHFNAVRSSYSSGSGDT
jgi:hypothetical protein